MLTLLDGIIKLENCFIIAPNMLREEATIKVQLASILQM